MSLFDHTLQELHTRLRNKEISVSDLVDQSYQRINEVDSKVRAFLTLDEENARNTAKELDKSLESSERGILFGLPAGVKDNIVTEGLRTTCSSKFLSDFVPIYDAAVMKKLKKRRP